MVKRVIIAMLDSVGIGYAHDAIEYGDQKNNGDVGANTVGHIIKKFPEINIPNLRQLGFLNCLELSINDNNTSNDFIVEKVDNPLALYGFGVEISKGKDTISGHWELMGCPVDFEWGYFHDKLNSFPESLLKKIYTKAEISGSLGNCVASGTEIIKKFGEEHIKTNKPIFYTSADSVFQIAAHEEYFGLNRLYRLCEIVREELYKDNIGRIIARPFLGEEANLFKRTGNRKDYSILPPHKTLLNVMEENHGDVIAIGKIADIFAHSGITKTLKVSGLQNLIQTTLQEISQKQRFSIIFTNFVDFDSEYGHRRDVKGYKEALEYFDSELPKILNMLSKEDLLVIIADHGNDPTWYGTDHTREHVPILFYGNNINPQSIGKRNTFSDVAQSIAYYLDLPKLKHGKSFLQ